MQMAAFGAVLSPAGQMPPTHQFGAIFDKRTILVRIAEDLIVFPFFGAPVENNQDS
jgi:hypothetical protein